jgi:signal transduction histidine kinase
LFHRFYRPLEAGLERLNTLAPSRSFPLRARTELLKRDLLALGWEVQAISELPTCTDLPSLREPEHFAGCLYVLEGAILLQTVGSGSEEFSRRVQTGVDHIQRAIGRMNTLIRDLLDLAKLEAGRWD